MIHLDIFQYFSLDQSGHWPIDKPRLQSRRHTTSSGFVLARIWRYSTYHDKGVRIQYVAICCDTVSKIIYCFIGPCSVFTLASVLLPVSDVTLEWKSRKAEDRSQHSSYDSIQHHNIYRNTLVYRYFLTAEAMETSDMSVKYWQLTLFVEIILKPWW